MKRLTAVVSAGVGAALGLTLAACSPLGREEMCMPDEYPVWSTDAPDSGRACVRNGEEPPAGYARYPAGHVPRYLDQDYTPTPSASPSR